MCVQTDSLLCYTHNSFNIPAPRVVHVTSVFNTTAQPIDSGFLFPAFIAVAVIDAYGQVVRYESGVQVTASTSLNADIVQGRSAVVTRGVALFDSVESTLNLFRSHQSDLIDLCSSLCWLLRVATSV